MLTRGTSVHPSRDGHYFGHYAGRSKLSYCKYKRSGGRVYKPDSVRRVCVARPAAAARLPRRKAALSLRAGATIPLGPESLRASSGLPEGHNGPGQPSPPIWPCTTRGLPCLERCRASGGLLPHRFTLAKRSQPVEDGPKVLPPACHRGLAAPAVCFLWHCP